MVKEMLGHASITMTVDLYGHLLPETQRDLADGLDAIYTTANSERPA